MATTTFKPTNTDSWYDSVRVATRSEQSQAFDAMYKKTAPELVDAELEIFIEELFADTKEAK